MAQSHVPLLLALVFSARCHKHAIRHVQETQKGSSTSCCRAQHWMDIAQIKACVPSGGKDFWGTGRCPGVEEDPERESYTTTPLNLIVHVMQKS